MGIRNVIFLFLVIGNINCKTHYWNTFLNKDKRVWWDQRKETIATVVNYLDFDEPYLQYSYVINSIKYTSWYEGYPFDNFCIGMKFYVAYNPDNHSQCQLQIWKPVLDDDEGVVNTEALVKWAWFSKYYSDIKSSILYVTYEFKNMDSSVNKKERHTQAIIYDSTIKPHNNVLNKKFKVKYWKENLNRSIIYLKEGVQ